MEDLQELHNYQHVYNSGGHITANSSSIFRFKCNAIGETINCPSFYKIEKLSRGSIFKITFSIIHNHHLHQRVSLSKKSKEVVKEIILKRLKETNSNTVSNSESIMEEIHQILSELGENIDIIRAIITRKYITSRLGMLSAEMEKKLKFRDLLLKPFQELWEGVLCFDKMLNVIILLEPQIFEARHKIVAPPLTRSIAFSNNNNNSNSTFHTNLETDQGFGFAYVNQDNLIYFYKLNDDVVIASDATHNTLRGFDCKLFTVWFFDYHMRRRNLVTMLLGSENEHSICKGLEKIKHWGEARNLKFPKIKCLLTDLAKAFYNAFSKTFPNTDSHEPIPWLYCSWHFQRALQKKLNYYVIPTEIKGKILSNFLFCVYARTYEAFMTEKETFFKYITKTYNNTANENNKNLLTSLIEIQKYFINKYKEEKRWAYYYRKDVPFGVNMSIERFHAIIKSYFPEKRSVRVDKLINILFKVEQSEIIRRISFDKNPKIDNMPYRLILNSNEYREFMKKKTTSK